MATGNEKFPTMHPVEGIQMGTASAGIKVAGRKDLVLMQVADGATTAAVFTQNKFCAAPVIIAKQHLQQIQPSYLLINTGNANAGTGEQYVETYGTASSNGACCLGTTCIYGSESACDQVGGIFNEGQQCADVNCGPAPPAGGSSGPTGPATTLWS